MDSITCGGCGTALEIIEPVEQVTCGACGVLVEVPPRPAPPPPAPSPPRIHRPASARLAIAGSGASGSPVAPQVTLGSRVAGIAMCVFALLMGLLVALAPGDRPGPGKVFGTMMLVDLVIGIGLAAGYARLPLRLVSLVRTYAGAIAGTAFFAIEGEKAAAAFVFVSSCAYIALLLGNPGLTRIIIASIVLGAILAVAGIGLVFISTVGSKPNALHDSVLRLQYDLETEPVSRLRGKSFGYGLTLTENHWFARRSEAVRKQNPLADVWLVRPDCDAHVLVIGEKLPPGHKLMMDAYASAVLAHARKAATRFELVEQAPSDPKTKSRLLHTRMSVGSQAFEYYYGLFICDTSAFQIMAMANQKGFPQLAPEFRQIIFSFEPPP